MNELFLQLLAEPWGRLVLQYAAQGGADHACLFLLVTSRLSGAFMIAPLLTPISIPMTVRMGVVVFLALLITPLLSQPGADVAEIVLTAYTDGMADDPMAAVMGLCCLIVNEVGLGTLFGVGVMAIVSGLRLTGELLDRHCGFGMGAVYNPEWSAGDSAGGTLMQLLGIGTFLLIEPIGGGELVLQCLIHSFRSIPAGFNWWSFSAIELLGGIVQYSLLFAIRIALPVMATMILIDLAVAFANRSPLPLVSASQLAIRASTGLVVLTFSTSAIPKLISAATISLVRLVSGIQ